MFVISLTKPIKLDFTHMKIDQSAVASAAVLLQARDLGERLARLRVGRRVQQSEAALRAGVSRNTAYRIEKGDPGVAFGQLLRYLDAIAPGMTLASLLSEEDPSVKAQSLRERQRRVNKPSSKDLDELDF
ncbi:Helix-turn-helix domain-containing protein [Paraburkholderia phenazinium]|jgi:transcriptional regulator with XRE-family HTH domain|uniref:Helix-turn-helix domain-containing protein n=2 Tax=Paraburkholderia phenazinium TaxID=60549 RepID=A0A1G7S8V6_9BURK|nr:helix-turn-helix transcriptional regulator [Paraburkholderia phenazinium]SDG19438.1 Helix-turn-helix domain-containing protein [Paraburkholderia phenazinium]